MRKMTTVLFAMGMVALFVPSGYADDCPARSIPEMNRADKDLYCETMLFAQADGRPRKGPGGEFGHGQRGEFGRQRKHLEQLRMLKMLELLDLDDDQQVEFLTGFNRVRQDQRAIEEQLDRVVDSIASEIESEMETGQADEARLNRLIDRSMKLQDESQQIMQSFVDDSRTMLTPLQVGKLIVFHKRFESELLERLGRFRGGERGPSRLDMPTPLVEDEG